MTNSTLLQSVRAFAPMNYSGAPIVAYAPDGEDGMGSTDTTPLSISEAVAAFTAVPETEEPDEGQPDVEDAAAEDDANEDEPLPDEDSEDGEEGETEDEGQAEDEVDDEPETEEGRYVAGNGKVRLPDGTTATVADLIQGNLRDRDYRQKTMELAEGRKTYEAQSQAVKQREEQLVQERDYVVSLVKSILPPQPDASKADPRSPNYDPAGYQAEEVAYRSWAQHLTHLQSEQQRTQEERQAETAKQTEERVAQEWTTALEKLPELKDPKRLEAFGKDTLKYGAEYGYTPKELANIHHDHRQLVVMKKAIAWDKLQASKTKVQQKVEGKPGVHKGGQRLDATRTKARSERAAMERLNTSGSLKDGIAALLATEQ